MLNYVAWQESEEGLFVCLQTFLGFGRDYVVKYSEKTGRKVFVNLKKIGKVVDSGEGESKFIFYKRIHQKHI